MAGTKKATPLTEEELSQKAADLQTQSDKLAQDQKVFEQSKTDFLNAQTEHGKAVEAADLDLNTRLSTLDERELNLNAREEKLDEREAAISKLENATAEEKPVKAVAGLPFEIEKEKFKFLDSAPKSILFDGKPRTQKDLVKDQEALLQLSSNKSLIEKIK